MKKGLWKYGWWRGWKDGTNYEERFIEIWIIERAYTWLGHSCCYGWPQDVNLTHKYP